MKVYCNGFWDGFIQETDGVHFGFFKELFRRAYGTTIEAGNINESEILLETHFITRTCLYDKHWRVSVFFCGEGSRQVPNLPYTIVMGAEGLACPLGLVYEYSTPTTKSSVSFSERKGICAVISSDAGHHEKRQRATVIDNLLQAGLHIDFGGRFRNNIGYLVEGNYYEKSIIDFYSKYKIVIAFENAEKPNYITEKIINAMRAGAVPLYFGGAPEFFIPEQRFLRPENIDEIKRVLTDEQYWNEKNNTGDFLRPMDVFINDLANQVRVLSSNNALDMTIIKNIKVENRKNYFPGSLPSYTVWSAATRLHPYWKKFVNLNQNQTSLAINHVCIFKNYQNIDRYLLVLESDAVPKSIERLNDIVLMMREHDIDFVFVGTGCFQNIDERFVLANGGDCPFYINLATTKKYSRNGTTIYKTNTSRCTEAYIVSPRGMQRYMEYFEKYEQHTAIDWDFNYFFYRTSTESYWAMPEIFYQEPGLVSYINTTKDL